MHPASALTKAHSSEKRRKGGSKIKKKKKKRVKVKIDERTKGKIIKKKKKDAMRKLHKLRDIGSVATYSWSFVFTEV